MAKAYDRDLIGYGPNPPDPKWPNGARLAVNFVINYEEGSEPSVQDGEGYSEAGLTESDARQQGAKGRDLAAETMFEYGSRVGFWRLTRLFQERRLPLTIFGCALALERNPLAAEAIRTAGFDVCSHGWRWIKHYELTRAQERQHSEGRRVVRQDDRRAAARVVLPLRTERQHTRARRRGRRLPLRLRRLQRRAPVLADGQGTAAPRGPVLAHQQRRQVCRLDRYGRPMVLVRQGRVRHAVSRGRATPEDDVGGPAYAHGRPSGARRGARAVARLHAEAGRRLDHPAP